MRNPGSLHPRTRIPDFALLHPGYNPLRCPTGKTRHGSVNQRPSKYSSLQNFGFIAFSRHLIPVRGAYRDRHETWGGLRWTRVTSARQVFAGRATVSRSVAHTTGVIHVWQNRVVLAPGVCAPSLVVMWRPDRARASAICEATGAIVHRSPGRARHKPSNHCAGKAGCLASPVCRCAASCSATFAQWTAGASRHPVFPAPFDI